MRSGWRGIIALALLTAASSPANGEQSVCGVVSFIDLDSGYWYPIENATGIGAVYVGESTLGRDLLFEGGIQYIFASESVAVGPGTYLGMDLGAVELYGGIRGEAEAGRNGYLFVSGGAGLVFVGADASLTGFPSDSDSDTTFELWYAVGAGVREGSVDVSVSFRSRVFAGVNLFEVEGDMNGTSFVLMIGKHW